MLGSSVTFGVVFERVAREQVRQKLVEHIRDCTQCAGPNDGCETGQEFEHELVERGGCLYEQPQADA